MSEFSWEWLESVPHQSDRAITLDVSDRETFFRSETELVEVVVHSDVAPIFVIRADCVPQLKANWLVVQPDVFRKNPTMGWEPVHEKFGVFVGREEMTQIELRESDPSAHFYITSLGKSGFEIENLSGRPIELLVRAKKRGEH